jgi:fructokinase
MNADTGWLPIPKTIVAVGEALWDVFPDGRRPGGAPCNVAFHAARLGDRGAIVTRVGEDAAGEELVAFLRERGVDTDCVQRDGTRPTGTVLVTIEDSEPQYAISEDVAWDYIAPEDAARALMRTADAICAGSLAQRSEASCAAIRQLLSDARGQALVLFDVNLRPPFTDAEVIEAAFGVADVVKMSESEVARLSTLLVRPSLIGWLLESVGVQAVCVTRGKGGAFITTLQGTVSAPGVEIDTSAGDAVGAGDAFTAAMAHQLVRNATLEETLHAANRYAALVATKKGAMPVVSSDELAEIGL